MIADLALVHAGLTPVSLYNTLAPEQVVYIANHCGAEVAFVEDAGFLELLASVRDRLPHLRQIVLIHGEPGSDRVVGLHELLASGHRHALRDPDAFAAMRAEVQPANLATLIYTSGTTGPPKAVMIDHRNVLWTVECCRCVTPLPRMVSYLPLAHVAERFVSNWAGADHGHHDSFLFRSRATGAHTGRRATSCSAPRGSGRSSTPVSRRRSHGSLGRSAARPWSPPWPPGGGLSPASRRERRRQPT